MVPLQKRKLIPIGVVLVCMLVLFYYHAWDLAALRSGRLPHGGPVAGVISRTCPGKGTKYPRPSSSKNTWYQVDMRRTAFVFSPAYLDDLVNIRVVHITGVRLLRTQGTRYFCLLWYGKELNGKTRALLVQAQTEILPQSHFKKYSSCIFKCPLPDARIPDSVSLLAGVCMSPNHALPVMKIKQQIKSRLFTVCSAPFHFRYSDVYELISWIEFNRILGADRFTLYNYSISANVDRVLKHYQKQGVVEVVRWQLPPGVQDPKEIHYYAQVSSLTDCLFRNKQYSEYMVNLDFDEYIIPRPQNITTWKELIDVLPNKNVYMFKNVFYRTDWEPRQQTFPYQQLAQKYRIAPLQFDSREEFVWPVGQRSKYICRSDNTRRMSIHHMILRKKANDRYVVPEEIAFLHHFRNWELSNDRNATRVKDDVIVAKYGAVLATRVFNAWSKIDTTGMNLVVHRQWSNVKKYWPYFFDE